MRNCPALCFCVCWNRIHFEMAAGFYAAQIYDNGRNQPELQSGENIRCMLCYSVILGFIKSFDALLKLVTAGDKCLQYFSGTTKASCPPCGLADLSRTYCDVFTVLTSSLRGRDCMARKATDRPQVCFTCGLHFTYFCSMM